MSLNDPTRKQIADRIRQARQMAGLSQGQVARILGLHRPSVSELEAGNRAVSAEELARMATTFDVSVSWLTGTSPERLDVRDDRIELAARELNKLKPDDLQRLLVVLASMRGQQESKQ